MHLRSATAALLVAGALTVAPVSTAFAAGPGTHPGAAKAAAAKAAHRLEHAVNTHRSIVLGGKVVSTTAAVAAQPAVGTTAEVPAVPGSVTLVVHGSRFKALRGTTLTVTVTDTTKVTREGPATLADVLVGDHVVVRARQLDVVVTKGAGGWTLAGAAVAVRLAASPTADSVEPVPPVPPVVPQPLVPAPPAG